jgi:CO/xanthine dehydrogenase FAD-binding subunit
MSVVVATSLADAVAALAAVPQAKVLAGGTDVMVELNAHHAHVEQVVLVNRVPELCTWRVADGQVEIGAGVTWAQVQRELAQWVPALAEAARTVGSPQIRHAATIGGNLGTCSPAGDGLPVLAALDAVVHLVSSAGERALPIAEFMVGPKRTAMRPGELITRVVVPVTTGFQGYAKVGVRNAMVIAIASAALVVDEVGQTVRLALGSVGPTVLRCPEAEQFAALHLPTGLGDAELARFAELARAAARPIDDHRATAAYRRHAVGVLAVRLLQRAVAAGRTS